MDNLKYNKSHAPDPTARDAITAADEMPAKVHGNNPKRGGSFGKKIARHDLGGLRDIEASVPGAQGVLSAV